MSNLNKTYTQKEFEAMEADVRVKEDMLIRMRSMVTSDGFLSNYFILLWTNLNKREAFEILNKEYFELFGRVLYKDFDEFIEKTVDRLMIK